MVEEGGYFGGSTRRVGGRGGMKEGTLLCYKEGSVWQWHEGGVLGGSTRRVGRWGSMKEGTWRKYKEGGGRWQGGGYSQVVPGG